MNVKELVDAIGKIKGNFASKANRIAKLNAMWPDLENKLEQMVRRGNGTSDTARLAYAVLLMMETGIRTGNETSAEGWICENQIICRKANKEKKLKVGDVIWQHPMYGKHVKTYGLTTLLNQHVVHNKRKKQLEISFVGKKLVDQELFVKNKTLVDYNDVVRDHGEYATVRKDDLFLGITYNDLKKFVKKYVGKNFTPKDLRMTKVNRIFIQIFGNNPRRKEFDAALTKSASRKILKEVIEETANIIGHTKSVCRSAYLSKSLYDRIYNEE